MFSSKSSDDFIPRGLIYQDEPVLFPHVEQIDENAQQRPTVREALTVIRYTLNAFKLFETSNF